MYKIFVILFLLVSTATFGQFIPEDMVKDIDQYKSIIEKKHINPFTKISKEKFETDLQNLIDSILKGMDTDEAYLKWMEINASLDDEHTTIARRSYLYPFYFILFDDDGIIVMQTLKMYESLLGARLIAIGDVPIDSIIPKLKKLTPGNENWKKCLLPYYLNATYILHGLKIAGPYAVNYTFLKGQDTLLIKTDCYQKDSSVALVPKEPLLRFSENKPYWFTMIDDRKALYFNYQKCTEYKEESMDEFLDRLKTTIGKKKPERIIIDLRTNSGGNSELLNPFIEYLARHRLAKEKKVFVLTGRATFSSALINAYNLKKRANATIIGDMSGGNVNHFGEIKSEVLKKTEIRLNYSTKYFELDKKYTTGLPADILITPQFQNRMEGIDETLNEALEVK